MVISRSHSSRERSGGWHAFLQHAFLQPCSLSDSERAEYYVEEQILTQLNAMASDGIYPRSFAYPYGHDLPAITNALLDYFDYVRDASFYPNHGNAYVACSC